MKKYSINKDPKVESAIVSGEKSKDDKTKLVKLNEEKKKETPVKEGSGDKIEIKK